MRLRSVTGRADLAARWTRWKSLYARLTAATAAAADLAKASGSGIPAMAVVARTIRFDNGIVRFGSRSFRPFWLWAGSSAPEHTLDKREVGRFNSSPAHHFCMDQGSIGVLVYRIGLEGGLMSDSRGVQVARKNSISSLNRAGFAGGSEP